MSYQKKPEKIPVTIVGAHGYTGLELARLLLSHPHADFSTCFGRNSQWSLSDDLPESGASKVLSLGMDELKSRAAAGDFKTAFLGTPPEVSMELAPLLLEQGAQVIDLSGAFRLQSEIFESWYGMPHRASARIEQAQYGLVPWNRGTSDLVSNPGCYATSVLMALIPLLKAQLIEPNSLVIDAKSGTSGAGRKAKENLLFTEVEGDCLPYRTGRHQHLPEIQRAVKEFARVDIDPHFSTQLLPVRRGILSGIYAKLAPGMTDLSSEGVLSAIDSAFEKAYESYPLVRFGRIGKTEGGDRMLLSLKRVVGSCRTHIGYTVQNEKLYLFSTIDNLLKGAASQAVENWNLAHGFPVETGLMRSEGQL